MAIKVAKAFLASTALLLALAPAALALEQKLTVPPSGTVGDFFGNAVAIEGDTAVVGAPSVNVGPNADAGAVFVFTRSGDSWTRTARLLASDGAEDDLLGFSVAIQGDTIAAGAPLAGGSGGAVYVFRRTGGVWNETARLTASVSEADSGDRLGWSVAIDGTKVIAGAPTDDVGADENQGAAFVFNVAGGDETAKLISQGGGAEDGLGWSVAIDGAVVVAGAPGAGLSEGAAYTFDVGGGSETTEMTASDAELNSLLGRSVAIQGSLIVAGAPGNPQSTVRGAAYTFNYLGPGGSLSESAKLTASDGAAGDMLGDAVAIDGSTVVVGAPGDIKEILVGPPSTAGAAYLFAASGADRTQTAKLTEPSGAASDGLGATVAIDGTTILAGAPEDDVGSLPNQGSATIYFDPTPVPPGPPPLPPAPTVAPAPRADHALGLEIAGKRLAVNRRGVARLRLRCSASEASPPCRGQLLLRTRAKLALGKGPKAKQRRIVLARASFRIPAGRTKAVKLRLGKAKLRLLKRTPRARKAQAIVRARDGAGNRRTVRKGLVVAPARVKELKRDG